jgi:hypothetical protein
MIVITGVVFTRNSVGVDIPTNDQMVALYLRPMQCSRCGSALLAIGFLACGKSAEQKAADVEACSATRTSVTAIAQCLRSQGGWRAAAAESAGIIRAHELDSIQAQIGAITARADSEHGEEVHTCDRVLVDLQDCLITRYGWEEDRARAADDSVWSSRGADHQQQIQSCLGRRGVGTGACLQLHYKWQPRRALALDDSIRRANINK